MLQLESISLTDIQEQLLELLRTKGPMTRFEICAHFHFNLIRYDYIQYPRNRKYIGSGKPKIRIQHKNRTTIYDNLLKLQKLKLVEKFAKNNGKRGRPKIYWKILN